VAKICEFNLDDGLPKGVTIRVGLREH
jgi:hypothetical protein